MASALQRICREADAAAAGDVSSRGGVVVESSSSGIGPGPARAYVWILMAAQPGPTGLMKRHYTSLCEGKVTLNIEQRR